MRLTKITHLLRILPSKYQFLLTFSLFACCLSIVVLGLIQMHTLSYVPLFTLPLTIAAWVYNIRIILFLYFCIGFAAFVCNSIYFHALLWPVPVTISYCCGMLALLFVAGSVYLFKRFYEARRIDHRVEKKGCMDTVEAIDESLYQLNRLVQELPFELSPVERESLQEQFTQLQWELRKRGIGK